MANTLEKLITVANENQKYAIDLCLKLKQSFTKIGTEKLIGTLKKTIKYTTLPEWVKEDFINYKGYTLKVGDDGCFDSIEISTKFFNETRNEQYYVKAKIIPTALMIYAGEHWDDMPIVSCIDDMEDLLGIKIFD